MSTASETLGYCFGQFYAAAHTDHVNILGRTFEEKVADIAANDITLHLLFVGHLSYEFKDRLFAKQVYELLTVEDSHYSLIDAKNACKVTKKLKVKS